MNPLLRRNRLHTKTFTLIEMLIVIVIIGILAAALIPRLQSVQGRARDSKRKVDLRTIANANEIFLTDNARYAKPCPSWGCPSSTSSDYTGIWIVELSGVLTSLPKDPINNGNPSWDTGDYSYRYGDYISGVVNYYDLVTQLENVTDPDRCQVKQYTYTQSNLLILPWCGGTGFSATYPTTKYLFVVSAGK